MEEKLFTEEEMLKSRKEGYESHKFHSEPSELTKLFMEETKKQFCELKTVIETLPTKKDLEILTLKLSEDILEKIDDHFVSMEKFKPVRNISYGIVAIIASGFVTLLILALGEKI